MSTHVFLYAVPMRLRPAFCFVTLAIFATNTTAAQNDVIRVNTRLVEVDVIVRAKDGPVTNLAKDDFTIFDNGKPQRVDVFSPSTAERSKPRENLPALPAGVVSNRDGKQAPRSATVILFDRLNTADKYQRDGRLQLLSYLKSTTRGDLTAIYVLGDGLKLVQDFTNDAGQLVRAATKMEVGDLPGVENRTVREIVQSTAVGRATRRDVRMAVAEVEFSAAERTDPTEDAIEFIARHLGALPGRKSLVWMSAAGIPLSISSGTSRDGRESQVGRATRLLTAANIAVYPVDIRGLKAPDPPRGRRGLEPNPPPDVMIRLADETGGRAFYFNNDLESSIRSAISDAEVSYTLGFYPSENGFDGKYFGLDLALRPSNLRFRIPDWRCRIRPISKCLVRGILAQPIMRSGLATIVFLAAVLAAGCTGTADAPAARLIERSRASMGTELRLTAWTADELGAAAAFDAVFEEVDRLEERLSNWREDSDVQRLNAAAGKRPVSVGTEIRDVLQTARQVSEWTSGKFDVTFGVMSGLWKFDYQNNDGTIPERSEVLRRLKLIDYRDLDVDERAGTAFLRREGMAVNLGGIGKGYAVDRARDILRRRGFRDFMIQFGGDMYVAGRQGERPWRLGIQDPRGPAGRVFAAVELSESTFSTSGDYERSFIKEGRRYHHIIDPATGEPAGGCRGVTIVAGSATVADGLSTGVFVLGPEAGMDLIERLPGVEGVIVSAKNAVLVSSGLKGRITLLAPPADAP